MYVSMYNAYLGYKSECERSRIEPLPYAQWIILDDLVD